MQLASDKLGLRTQSAATDLFIKPKAFEIRTKPCAVINITFPYSDIQIYVGCARNKKSNIFTFTFSWTFPSSVCRIGDHISSAPVRA